MIGMDFIAFLILLIISVVVSAVLHYGFKYYVTTWNLVILLEGYRRMDWCVAGLAGFRLLAAQDTQSPARRYLVYPGNPGRPGIDRCGR